MNRKLTVLFIGLILFSSFMIALPVKAQSTLGDGLVLYLPFNEGSGDVLIDYSGLNNHGSQTSCTWVSGKFGLALSLDGVSSSYTVADSLSLRVTSDWSYSIWLNSSVPIEGDSSYHEVFVQRTTSNKIQFRVNNDGHWIVYYRSTGAGFSELSAVPKFNVWSNIVIVKNATLISLYQDGVFVTSANDAENFLDDSHAITNSYVGITKGDIDDFRIYNRALTSQEVADLYNYNPSATPTPTPTQTPTTETTINYTYVILLMLFTLITVYFIVRPISTFNIVLGIGLIAISFALATTGYLGDLWMVTFFTVIIGIYCMLRATDLV